MRRWLAGALLALSAFAINPALAAETVRVAVVGGLVMCGVWPALVPLAEQATGLKIETVAAAPKEGIVPVFRRGEADLLIMHGSDETYALQAAGLAAPLRAWAMNEHVIVGPTADPAHIAGSRDGTEALERILKANAPMIGFRDPGSFSIVAGLLRAAGLRLGPRQQLFDDGESPQGVLHSAAANQAYVVVGHIPVAVGKMQSAGMLVLLKSDPAMRRVYVAIEPGPRHPASRRQRKNVRQLVNYLLGPEGQSALARLDVQAGGPWIFPLPKEKAP